MNTEPYMLRAYTEGGMVAPVWHAAEQDGPGYTAR
jgi:hypothetical protein